MIKMIGKMGNENWFLQRLIFFEMEKLLKFFIQIFVLQIQMELLDLICVVPTLCVCVCFFFYFVFYFVDSYITWHFSLMLALEPSPPSCMPPFAKSFFFGLDFLFFLPSSCSETVRVFSMFNNSCVKRTGKKSVSKLNEIKQ